MFLQNERPDPLFRFLTALNRFLNSPLKRKHMIRTARQALDFVAREDRAPAAYLFFPRKPNRWPAILRIWISSAPSVIR